MTAALFDEASGEELVSFFGISWDDEIIERYTPALAEGRFLDTQAEEPEAVIADEETGLSVGDEPYIRLGTETGFADVKVKIVGRLEKGARVFGAQSGLERPDCRSVLPVWQSGYGGPLLLFSRSALQRLCPDVFQPIHYTVMVKYPDSADDALIESELKALTANASIAGLTTARDMRLGSLRYIGEQLYALLPLVIVLAALSLASSVNASALAARQRLRDCAKLYIVGMTWKKCALVSLLSSMMSSAAAAVLAAVGMLVIKNTALSRTVTASFGLQTAAVVAALAALNAAFSAIMPLMMLSRNTPTELLRTK